MALGDPELPRAELQGDKLFITGEEKPYFRDPERTAEEPREGCVRSSVLLFHDWGRRSADEVPISSACSRYAHCRPRRSSYRPSLLGTIARLTCHH